VICPNTISNQKISQTILTMKYGISFNIIHAGKQSQSTNPHHAILVTCFMTDQKC